MNFEIDHLVVTAQTLKAGVADVEARLGVEMAPGGAHPIMGTHNRLLGLGPGLYMEVIAVDPGAPPPPHARWFGLDAAAGAPRLSHWVARGDDIDAALARAPAGTGRAMAAARGALSWRISVPEDGRQPFDGAFAALIEWDGAAHPADTLPESHCRLERLELVHPQATALEAALAPIVADARIAVVAGAEPGLRAHLATPRGPRVLT